MPELPEVETVVRDLRPLIVGRTIRSVEVGAAALRSPWLPEWGRALTGRKVKSLGRRGKWILISLSRGGTLLVHLGMTGQLTVRRATEALADHTHLRFGIGGRPREELRFRDVRRFGSATYFPSSEELTSFLDARLGPEPFGLDAEYWLTALGRTKRAIKAALLDQQLVAGVGNIYADESLFAARIHPATIAADLDDRQADRLREAIARVMTDAIEKRGSSIRDYIGGSGLGGGYQDEFAVYGRTGEPCPNCGHPIDLMRISGRSTHFCRECQPEA